LDDFKTPSLLKKTVLAFKTEVKMKYYDKNIKLVFNFTIPPKASIMRFRQKDISFVQLRQSIDSLENTFTDTNYLNNQTNQTDHSYHSDTDTDAMKLISDKNFNSNDTSSSEYENNYRMKQDNNDKDKDDKTDKDKNSKDSDKEKDSAVNGLNESNDQVVVFEAAKKEFDRNLNESIN